MLKQGSLTNELSPSKPAKSCKTPNDVHVLSTPVNFSRGANPDLPPLNWEMSMIDSTINKSDENKQLKKECESTAKTRRKPLEIKSKYMQSATKRKTPAVGKTPSTVSNLNQTAKTGSANKSNRQKIDELNREDTFHFDKNDSQTTVKTAPNQQPIVSKRKPLRTTSKDANGTPRMGRKTTSDSSVDTSSKDRLSSSGGAVVSTNSGPLLPPDPNKISEVTEEQLHVLENQKLQLLYILSKLESTQESLSNEASCQMYQMWKVKENLRAECSALKLECLVKEYICEVNAICEALLPVCSELSEALPKFDKQFVTLCTMLDSTRHYISTVQIARLRAGEVDELQTSLKQVLEQLKHIHYNVADDKENLMENAQELTRLRSCFELSAQQYASVAKLASEIKRASDESLFLTATFSQNSTTAEDEALDK